MSTVTSGNLKASIASDQPEFGKIRAFLWPIQHQELKKFLPMGLIMFCMLFIYTMLRDTKDTLVVTADGGGAAMIPFLKLGVTLPAAILFVVIYSKLSNVMSREKLFYTIVSSFLIFFGLFAFVLYPNREMFHPDPIYIEGLKSTAPNFQHWFSVFGLWSYSIFYMASELWGTVMVTLLFWQFANEITRTREAKRFYGFFGLIANFSLIASGYTINIMSDIREGLPAEVDAWGLSLNYMMGAVVIAGIAMMFIYRWMNMNVLTDPKYYDAAESKGKTKAKKPKLSITESFKYVFSSKYLGLIAILVVGYGLCINLVEIVWKSQLKLQYPNSNDYSAFMGKFSFATGVFTILLIFMFKGVVRRFGWFTGAIITPAIVFVTGLGFFAFICFNESTAGFASLFGATPLMLAVLLGAAQNILSKGTKYALFDPTKEMSYIPLDQELKVKGKAAVDVIGSRLGKGGGGFVAAALLMITASSDLISIAPILAIFVTVMIVIWMYGVKGLSKLYANLLTAQEKTAAPVQTAAKEIKKAAA